MKKLSIRFRAMAGFLLIAALMGGSPVQAADWMMSVTTSFSSGHYGTTSLFNDIFIPVSLRRIFPWGSVELSVPFVASTVISPAGGSGGGIIRNVGPGQSTLSSTPTSGAGDIRLRGRYYLSDEFDGAPVTTSVTAGIKIPTADTRVGLGTGAFDARAGLELARDFTKEFYGFLDGGYTVVGRSSAFPNLINQWDAAVGIGYEWSKSVSTTLTYVEESQATLTVPNFRAVYGGLNYWYSKVQRVKFEMGAGLSTQAPAYTVSLGWSTLF